MPIAAAVGTIASSAMTAIGSVTLAGLAQGAAIVGTGLSVVGGITGNKTISKIGMGIGLAGGAGMMASSSGLINGAATIGSSSKGLLASTDAAIKTPTKGVSGTQLKTFPGGDKSAGSSVADSFYKSSDAIGGDFDPQFEKNYFQRANDTLTRYNTLLNVAGGIGQTYMQGEQMQLQRDLQKNNLAFEQQMVDRVNTNNGTVLSGVNPAVGGVSRDPTAYTGILRGR